MRGASANGLGTETGRWCDRTRVGYDSAHALVDDHSRLTYVELLDDERAPTVTAFVARALTCFEAHRLNAKRLMTDNAWSYTHNNSLRATHHPCDQAPAHPGLPAQTNRKVERFHQTMAPEWAYGSPTAHNTTAPSLATWLEHYNTHRPHSAIANRPPSARIHNLRRQDS